MILKERNRGKIARGTSNALVIQSSILETYSDVKGKISKAVRFLVKFDSVLIITDNSSAMTIERKDFEHKTEHYDIKFKGSVSDDVYEYILSQ